MPTTGEWVIDDASLRGAAVVLACAGVIFSGATAWAAASFRVERLEERVLMLEHAVQQWATIRSDLEALVRLQCLHSSETERVASGLRCGARE